MAMAWLFSIFRLQRSDDQNESHCQPPPSNSLHLPPHRNHCFLAREKLWDVIFTYSFRAIALEIRYRRKFSRFSTVFLFFFSFILFPFALAIFNLACFCLYLSKRLFPWSYRIAAIKVGGKTRYIRFCFVTFHTLWLVQKKLSLPSHPSGSEAHTRKAPNHFVASCSLWLLSVNLLYLFYYR